MYVKNFYEVCGVGVCVVCCIDDDFDLLFLCWCDDGDGEVIFGWFVV